MQVRDRLGELFPDAAFADPFGRVGKPGWSPGRVAVVTVLQKAANLTDRQAADEVRENLSWKYPLGLTLDDPGFDHSVLSEFRTRVVEHALEERVLDLLLERLRAINAAVERFLARGLPVVSVDVKQKEPIGDFARPCRTYRPKGRPVTVPDHDFTGPATAIAIPYGIYDLGRDSGWVNVGTNRNTGAFGWSPCAAGGTAGAASPTPAPTRCSPTCCRNVVQAQPLLGQKRRFAAVLRVGPGHRDLKLLQRVRGRDGPVAAHCQSGAGGVQVSEAGL